MEEMRVLEKNKTWDLYTLSKGFKTLRCKCIPLKYKENGILDRHKVSLQERESAVLIVYVNDIVLSGDDIDELVQLKKKMGFEFEIKDLGNLKYFLGMEIARAREGICIPKKVDRL
ncbi:Reverse transcriptase, RNA-dependent DNA polymerase [Cucumis melo var. makuwa]|uniref:Reverse transcriptase, RNA-dependent DNA polymerase n=1 Tax=Cucumis melo var. makuwa TaxID=1194695 RepID=A0A5A7U6L8_CUCMM|nr:Reverse transcriptase, RNA-dependent DNA polymerase [Cucumis melo var. makuwa]TYK23059.1 Reverse transcriptase, RNA-dependent DNA polymerase [Cucumis melo var. makuwa]